MADLYVSTTNGDDANDGSSEANAWATINKAASEVNAGDRVRIAPGTYREIITADNAGSDGSEIRFIGDPECQYFDNENPGRVRVTGADSDEVEQAVTVIDSDQDYVEWHRLSIDGGDRGIDFGSSRDTTRVATECYIHAAERAINQGSAYKCRVTAPAYGYVNTTVSQSIGVGGDYGFYDCIAYNCLQIGGFRGFAADGNSTLYNCVAWGSDRAFFDYNTTTGDTADNCTAIACDLGTESCEAAQLADCHAVMCDDDGLFDQGDLILFPLDKLADLMPWFATARSTGLLRQGDNTGPSFDSDDTDVTGHALRMKGSDLDRGPWSIPEPLDYPGGAVDWDTYESVAPGLNTLTEGDRIWPVPCQAGVTLTVKVQSQHDGIGAEDKPQLILRGDSIAEQIDTNTAGDATWDELSVSATPTFDEVLTVIFRARNASGNCYWSDRVITKS